MTVLVAKNGFLLPFEKVFIDDNDLLAENTLSKAVDGGGKSM